MSSLLKDSESVSLLGADSKKSSIMKKASELEVGSKLGLASTKAKPRMSIVPALASNFVGRPGRLSFLSVQTPRASERKHHEEISASKYQMGFSHFKQKCKRLDQQIYQQKNLINMVIHDLRCPTAQIQHAVTNQQSALEALKDLILDLSKYFLESEDLIKTIISGLAEEKEYNGPRLYCPVTQDTRGHQLCSPGIQSMSTPGDNQKPWLEINTSLDLPDLEGRLSPHLTVAPQLKEGHLLGQPRSSQFQQPNISSKELSLESYVSSSEASFDHGLSPRPEDRKECEESSDDEANASLPTDPHLETAGLPWRNKCFIENQSRENFAEPKLIEEVRSRNIECRSQILPPLPTEDTAAHELLCGPGQSNTAKETLRCQNLANFAKSPPKFSIKQAAEALSGLREKAEETLYVLSEEVDSLNEMTASCEYSSAVLLNLINDLMDLAKAENNAFTINNNFFDLEKAVLEAEYTLSFMALQKEISTQVQITSEDTSKLKQVLGDSGRLKQVLVNLMSNALKFTNEGGNVNLKISLLESTPITRIEDDMPHLETEDIIKVYGLNSVRHSVQIDVIDDGQGISPEGQSKLFKNYASLAEHKKSNERGTGLGLCICKQIVELMGGQINVNSTLGEGTTFSLVIPFLSVDMHSATSSKISGIPARHNVSELKDLEERTSESEDSSEDSDTESMTSSEEEQVPASRVPLNLREPTVTNSREEPTPQFNEAPRQTQLTMQMKSSLEESLENTSQDVEPGSVNPARARPFTKSASLSVPKHLSKGKSLRQAFQMQRNQFRNQSADHVIVPLLRQPSRKWQSQRILIVNDEPVGLMVLEKLLKDQLGITQIEKATNGQAALDKATEAKFDIIFMDLNMPILNGFEATKAIKSRAAETKIVALSASSFTGNLVEQCSAAGFDSHLTVPVDLQKLTGIMEVFAST